MTAWLHLVGIGADGLEGLSPAARRLVEGAEVIVGGARHQVMTAGLDVARIEWPKPFDTVPGRLAAERGRRVVVLLTGDPFWHSAGPTIAAAFDPAELRIHPHASAFQLAAARMGWPLETVETLSAHGRAPEVVLPALAPGARILILTSDGGTAGRIARLLSDRGYGGSAMTTLSDIGGPGEARHEGRAAGWSHEPGGLNTLAIEARADAQAQLLSRAPGLPDAVFSHDGQMTKREVRAVTLSRLMPQQGALLWDIGAGCGSVSVEWMRAARGARAIGIEPDAGRRAMAAENALALGAPDLDLVDGWAPDALDGLPQPAAVFVGGGLSAALAERALDVLPPLGRLVANAVTLESEGVLAGLHDRFGGDLIRLQVHRARPIGPYSGWEPSMPVTQWSLIKR